MAQFDVYPNPVAAARGRSPYLLEIQSDLLGPMITTVVVPLVRPKFLPARFERLTPLLAVQGEELRLSTPELFSIPRRALSAAVLNLGSEREALIGALDHLISGI